MITHVVLFRPRPHLTAEARQSLAAVFARALREIPSVRRARVGRRITQHHAYEALMTIDYQYLAVLEFDNLAGLNAYLEHPAHAILAEQFFASVEDTLMYDFDLQEGDAGVAALLRT